MAIIMLPITSNSLTDTLLLCTTCRPTWRHSMRWLGSWSPSTTPKKGGCSTPQRKSRKDSLTELQSLLSGCWEGLDSAVVELHLTSTSLWSEIEQILSEISACWWSIIGKPRSGNMPFTTISPLFSKMASATLSKLISKLTVTSVQSLSL